MQLRSLAPRSTMQTELQSSQKLIWVSPPVPTPRSTTGCVRDRCIAEPCRHVYRHAFQPTSPDGRVLRLATIPRAVWLAACQRQRERRLSRERGQREERRWHTRWTYRPPCRPARPRPIPKPNTQPGPVALKRRNPLNRSDLQAISRVLNPAVPNTISNAPSRRGYQVRARSARIPPWRRATPTPARTRRRATPHARSHKTCRCLNWGPPPVHGTCPHKSRAQ